MTSNYTITKNETFKSLEIKFNTIPSETIRETLKSLKFRWNRARGLWYGYATEETIRQAIEGKTETTETKKTNAGTPQNHIRIYYNGIKIDGGKLIRCGYSLDNHVDFDKCVTIYARSYGDDLPRDLLEVKNDTDIMTDYFCKDSATLTPSHPLYKYFRYAAMKAQAKADTEYCERLRKTLTSGEREPWPGHFENLRHDLERREKFLEEFKNTEDPGQPTAEDLEQINRERQQAENARKEAERREELRQRENATTQRVNGEHLINEEMKAHPLKDSDSITVMINWSEHPAFTRVQDDSLIMSLTAAENILKTLDQDQHDTRETPVGHGWYYKTKFTITGTDDNGEPVNYVGRYDLGDGDGGLIAHIRAHGEWYRTHDVYGHEIKDPEDTNDIITFADFLKRSIA